MRHRILFFALAAVIAACGSDGTTAPSQTVAGTYSLKTVNGSALPFKIVEIGDTTYALAGIQLNIAGAGTWTASFSEVVTVAGKTAMVSVPSHGSWAQTGTSITLHFLGEEGPDLTGPVTSNRLDLTDGFVTYVFTK